MGACKMRSAPWLPPPSRSRSSLPQRGITPSGSEAPSWLPSPPSSRCGSRSRSTTSAAHPLSTASASKRIPTSVEEKQHTGSYRHHLHLLYFHCPAVWSTDIVQLHPTVYYIPSSTLTPSFYKNSHRETFVNSLTVYWHHLRNIRILCVKKKKS